ncbi:d8a2ed73-e8e6-451d-8739-0cd78f9153c9 [Thermothielavioides terrestris]|uniref:D8a2ed73-e8e6-451d-8739-0cd78f9153c9 n=1 Tax=Thermothielavioides terrestris TaxID=2587410 RepID=A0A3S4C8C4_9PEZI|nr:d8a2ed73-e8e6-451d-8739-0cd78f9153c9 [Thermothielavioides terrestris]
MAPLAASRTVPSVSLSHSQRSDVISALHPLVNSALRFQQLVGSAAFHLFVRTYFAATVVAAASVWASKSAAWKLFLASRLLAARGLVVAKRLAWTAWDCRQSRRFRKRLEFELFVLLLGPGGNAVLLMIFWPGWLMLAFLGWCIWQLTS